MREAGHVDRINLAHVDDHPIFLLDCVGMDCRASGTEIKIFFMNKILSSLFAMTVTMTQAHDFQAPATEARPVVDMMHGVAITDPYRWLEDKSAPQVQTWTRAQHAATMQWLDQNAPSPAGLRDDLARYVDRTIVSAPTIYKGQEFFTRKSKGQAQAKLYTRINGAEVMLFDPVALDPSGKTSLSTFVPSRHDQLIAVSVQKSGSEINDTHFIDRTTGAVRSPALQGVTSVSFAAQPNTIFFTIRNRELIDSQKPLHTYALALGQPLSAAVRVVENDDAKNWVGISEPERSNQTMIERGDFWSRTFTVRPLGSRSAPQVLFASKKSQASVQLVGPQAYVRTNENAPNWKLMRATLGSAGTPTLAPLLPEKTDALLAGFDITNTHIVTREKRNLSHEIRLYSLDGKPDAAQTVLTPPEFGDASALWYDHHADQLYIALSTFNAPSTLYRVDPKTFEWTRIFQDESAIDTAQIETTRIDIPTRDGKKVPAFVSMKKGTKLDGARPVLLYGYGGFNIGINVSYVGAFAALINRGVVFVHAGIRGGNEFGEAWHQDGMLFKKQNTFNDFIDSAQWLIANNYTNPQKLAIMGGSNGGLLVGAVAAQRPDLFKAVVCSVPLLDMLRFEKFLIARYWIPEYGDAGKAEDFRNLLSYSPYHNIRTGLSLPATMVIAGENDTRVDPLHAKKFVARLQNNQGQTHPIMLKMDFDSGHGSGKSTQQLIEDREVWMRFLLKQLG